MEESTTRVVWRERMTFDAITNSKHSLVLDSAPPNGDDRGARPMELLLTALAGCTAMDVLSILEKKREPVEAFQVSIRAARADEHPKVYTDIQVLYHVWGKVNPQSVQHAIELSENKYCGVAAMLGKCATISTRYEIENALAPSLAAPAE